MLDNAIENINSTRNNNLIEDYVNVYTQIVHKFLSKKVITNLIQCIEANFEKMVTTTYLHGINLICTDEYYYVFDAHGDVVNLTDEYGVVVKTYEYDAFGVEKNPDESDTNPFRYCGEYWDSETETYYLRARYYDPNLGRFTGEDTHWNVSNMIYGDNPQKINDREDMLGLKTYSYAPSISAITQSGNLYVYCGNNPVMCVDSSGYKIVFIDTATSDQVSQYERAIEYLKKSSTAAALIEKLEEAEETYKIKFIKGKNNGFSIDDNTIHFNPYIGHRMADGFSVQSAAVALAHEMGHAAYKLDNPDDFNKYRELKDRDSLERINLDLYETPIANELGEPTRTLSDKVKAVKRNNSTHFTTGYQVTNVLKVNLIFFSIRVKEKINYLTQHNEY